MTRQCKVFSIFGMPYEPFNYPDKRGPQVTFRAACRCDGSDKREFIEVTGTKVVFGLVLHRRLSLNRQDQPTRRQAAWDISEPITGCRVVAGWTRQDALDCLADRVAFLGGEDAFCQAVKQSILEAKSPDIDQRDLSSSISSQKTGE